jgi:hypothetical protein
MNRLFRTFLHILQHFRSPATVFEDLNEFRNFYNLTMTYRKDANIPWYYGYFIKNSTGEIISPSSEPKWLDVDEDFYGAKYNKF